MPDETTISHVEQQRHAAHSPISVESAHGGSATPAISPRALHVLIVDDEPMVRMLLQAYLRVDGHTAVGVGSGNEGLEALEANRFDLIVTDQSMPVMSGDQFAAAAEALAPNAPVIMLTGLGGDLQARGIALPNVDLVLGKPILQSTLREGIAKVLPQV